MRNGVNVFSEIGPLKEVVVQCPGRELENFDIAKRDKYLMDGDIDYLEAIREHKAFVKILKKYAVRVYYFDRLFSYAWKKTELKYKKRFLHKFVEEAKVRKNHRRAVYNYLCTLIKNRHRVLIRKLIEGVTYHNIDLHRQGFVADPLDNIYFQRDTYSSIGNTVSIHRMKYHIRQRESLLSEFLFKFHPRFKRIKKVYSRNEKLAIEGGDIFPYNQQTLVVGVSERTSLNAILKLANNLKKSRSPYQQIVAINVPKAGRLMHLDTWLTMVDYDKFIYSPNAVKNFKFWIINIRAKKIVPELIKNATLKGVLKIIFGNRFKPILIPVGNNKNKFVVDRETKYDGTNYLVIRPGLVVGYDRNRETNKALKKAGVHVLAFRGDELSLGEGNARCMSMPIWRSNWGINE